MDLQSKYLKENSKNNCKYCKRKALDPVVYVLCEARYHPSCSTGVGRLNKEEKFTCCENRKQSEVKPKKVRKNSERSDIPQEMDEKKIRGIIKESFQQFLMPLEQKIDNKLKDVEPSIQFMSDSFEEQRKGFDELLVEIQNFRQENFALKAKLATLEERLDDIEVAERSNNIMR